MKTEENKTIASNSGAEIMEARNIAHMVGRMDAILKIIEFGVLKIKENEYLVEILINQVNEAKAINDEIFEMHKKNEIEKIKITYSNENE